MHDCKLVPLVKLTTTEPFKALIALMLPEVVMVVLSLMHLPILATKIQVHPPCVCEADAAQVRESRGERISCTFTTITKQAAHICPKKGMMFSDFWPSSAPSTRQNTARKNCWPRNPSNRSALPWGGAATLCSGPSLERLLHPSVVVSSQVPQRYFHTLDGQPWISAVQSSPSLIRPIAN